MGSTCLRPQLPGAVTVSWPRGAERLWTFRPRRVTVHLNV
jgi:hypothetical protein